MLPSFALGRQTKMVVSLPSELRRDPSNAGDESAAATVATMRRMRARRYRPNHAPKFHKSPRCHFSTLRCWLFGAMAPVLGHGTEHLRRVQA